jgi:hypothetical protein
MGRERGQSLPDLFSADVVRDNSPPRLPAVKAAPAHPQQRHVLTKNLPNAVKHLNDDDLESLHAATLGKMKRRGKTPPSGSGALPRNSPTKRDKGSNPRHREVAGMPLPSGKVKAVRAAFMAGIRPASIARQFGISKSNVMRALAINGRKR